MDMDNPDHTEVMKLEGIARRWAPTREEGYSVFRSALANKLPSGRRGISTAASSLRRTMSTAAAATPTDVPTVGVIGGGVAGLQTVRALREKGFDVTLFEAADSVGGVWRENYLGFGVQVPKQLYEFVDFPMDEVPHGEYPTGAQTQAYVERYVERFGLQSALRLATRVQRVQPAADGNGWTLVTEPSSGGSAEEHQFDKVVVCSGMYDGQNKKIPLPEGGRSSFAGDVMHTYDFRRPDQVKGKRVVVVGNGKSAVDCAVSEPPAVLVGGTFTMMVWGEGGVLKPCMHL